MGRKIVSGLIVGLTVFALSACGSGSQSAVTSTVTVSSTAAAPTPAPPIATPTPTSSGDPLYDRYAAALQAANIPFTPGTGINYGSAFASYQSDLSVCESIRSGTTDAVDLKYVYKVGEPSNEARRYTAMIPILCPDQQAVLDNALSPNPVMQSFLSGKHFVGYGETSGGATRVQPGTYRTATVSDCYWERLDGQGNIIDNNMVSLSESVVVTIAESDAAFNSQDCGTWTRVN